MSRQTRRTVLASMGGAAALGLAGCSGSDGGSTPTDTPTGESDGGTTTTESGGTGTETETGTANVRVAHMSPDAPNVDVYVDDGRTLSDVPFRAISDYLEVPAGTRALTVTAAGDESTVAFEGDVEVAAGTDYTIAAIGDLTDEDTEFRPLVLEDDNSDPGGDTARVRVVHASPDAPAVDVTTASDGSALVDGAAFGGAASVEVPAGQYTLQVRGDTEDDDGDVVGEYTVELSGDTVYTAFASGYLAPEDGSADRAFDLTLAVDAGAGGGGLVETANVRVAHMSPDAPNVDVYVDDGRVLSDVPFRAVSDYLELGAGSHTVRITAAGDEGTVAFEGDVEVAAGTDYTIAAIGELTDEDTEFRPLVLEDDNSDPGGDTARIRVVHASPDAPAVDVTTASDGSALFEGVAFADSGYRTVPANDYTLGIRDGSMDGDGGVVADFDVSLNGGSVYTAFASGYLSPDEEPADEAFDLTVVEDAGY